MEDASFGYLPGKFKLSKSKIKELIEILNLEVKKWDMHIQL